MEMISFVLKMMLLVAVSPFSTTWVTAEVSEFRGSQMLDKREAEVTLLKNKVEENYQRRCEFLRTCGAPMNCSRHACEQLNLGGVQHYLTCKNVVNNEYCLQPTYCPTSKYFDFTRSYVRVAANPLDTSPAETTAIICSQRELDATFKSICTNDSHTRLFLGTVDGTYIHFPGSARNPAARDQGCYNFDPRLRPWFRASTSVRKIVMVLIDGGALRSSLATPLLGFFHDLTHDIVKDLLNTLSEQDVVNIIVYDNSGPMKMSSLPVQFVYNVSANSTYHPEFAELLGNLRSAESRGGSNITNGITEALANYDIYDETYMKIIIVFTYGYGISSLKNDSLTPLEGRNVKVFVFVLPLHTDQTPAPNSPFLTQLQSLGGSYNVLSTMDVKNRLLSMLPYFSFLAHFRASLNNSADYSVVYQDFEQVVRMAFSITKPVFADGGRLLGTVGLNILADELPEDDAKSVNLSLSRRIGGKAFDPSKFVLTAANASINRSNSTTECEGPSIKQPVNAGLCEKNDSSPIEHFACCGSAPGSSCILPPNPAPTPSTSSRVKVIVGSVLASVGAVVAIILWIFMFVRWRRKRREILILGSPPPLDEEEHRPAHSSNTPSI